MTILLILKPKSLKIGQNWSHSLNTMQMFLISTFWFQPVIQLNTNIYLENY
jgi:hypothetical protein